MTSSPTERPVRPPRGGQPPPAEVDLPGGRVAWLRPVAEDVSRRLHDEFPEERERYGPAGFEWCVHDNQYLLHWASLSADVFERQLDWLAGLLAARGYPLARLARDLELAAEAAEDAWGEDASTFAARLRGGAERVKRA